MPISEPDRTYIVLLIVMFFIIFVAFVNIDAMIKFTSDEKKDMAGLAIEQPEKEPTVSEVYRPSYGRDP